MLPEIKRCAVLGDIHRYIDPLLYRNIHTCVPTADAPLIDHEIVRDIGIIRINISTPFRKPPKTLSLAPGNDTQEEQQGNDDLTIKHLNLFSDTNSSEWVPLPKQVTELAATHEKGCCC